MSESEEITDTDRLDHLIKYQRWVLRCDYPSPTHYYVSRASGIWVTGKHSTARQAIDAAIRLMSTVK